MTRVAKWFIFLNLVVSIVLASWAMGIYTQRIEWGPKAATADRAAGELAKRNEEIKRYQEARTRSEARFDTNAQALAALERRRAEDVAWYAKELRDLETAPTAVKTLLYDRGQLRLDANGRPALEEYKNDAGQAVPGVQALNKQYAQLQGEITAEMQALDQLVKEAKTLTEQINGDGMTRRGLRAELAAEQQARRESLQEQDYLEPLRYNRQVDTELLLKRQKQLKTRLQELQGSSAVTRSR